jgi:hypothetical protein
MPANRKDATLAQVLNEALLDEYKARDTYRKIIDTFGAVRPFVNIVEAEQRHIESLLALYEKYELPLPAIPDPDQIDIPDSLLKACQMGVDAEIENLTMYDRLIEATDLPEVIEVLKRLQAASRDNHLPAFQRCVERGGAAGPGPGLGPRNGSHFVRGRGPGRRAGRPRR